jgi:hypothetical protein
MIQKYLSLAIALFLQMILINMIFGQIKIDKDDENYDTTKMLTNVLQLLLMLVVNLAIIYNVLKDELDRVSLYFAIGLSSSVILLFWFVYRTDYLSNYISRVDYDTPNALLSSNNSNHSNTNNNVSNKFPEPTKAPFEGVAFSKYHNKDTNRDFTFENSYPNYNEIPPSLESTENNSNSNSNNSDPDYSMYNGYDAGDICYQCKCIEEDGDKFCAKEIPGMGRIGCSERWECLNCKDCQTWDDERFGQTEQNNTDKRYTCQDCKCLNTTAGKICGRVSRADGFVQKCDSDCKKCDKCYGQKSTNSNNSNNSNGVTNEYITIKPSSNLNRIIVNNLKNTDLNDVLD